jgi:uncharacterized protein (DUF427 family)
MTTFMHAVAPPSRELLVLEPSPRWIRGIFGGETVADSRRAAILTGRGHGIPVYYFPRDDVRTDLLVVDGQTTEPATGDAVKTFTVRAGGREAKGAAWSHPPADDSERPDLSGYIAFDWPALDAWFEEDEEVFVHARDPYKRIDVLQSARHVQVVVGGEQVADTRRPAVLFETGLPPRYYIPKLDVRVDLLSPTSSQTSCPYKGDARYWSVTAGGETHEDLVWSYPFPLPEVAKIANLLCFYQERVDAVVVDGQEQPRPRTHWS